MLDLGNVPCYIDKTAKLKTSVTDLVMSKSFDNGMICAAEQAVIVDKEIVEEFEAEMKRMKMKHFCHLSCIFPPSALPCLLLFSVGWPSLIFTAVWH